MPVLEGKILNAGKYIVSEAMAGLSSALPHHFDVGSAYGFSPSSADTVISGTKVFTGQGDLVQVNIVAEDTVRYVCSIPENYGPFDVGNMILFMTDTDGTVLPYFEVVLPVPVKKLQSEPSQTQDGYSVPGTRLAISIQIKHHEEAIIESIDILTPTYSSFPTFYSESDVPLGVGSTYGQFIVSYDTRTKGPVLYTIDADGVRWGMPFTHQLEDPNFGHMNGGIDGEGYGQEPDEIVWGGLFTTPNESYQAEPVGGGLFTTPYLVTVGTATFTRVNNDGSYQL